MILTNMKRNILCEKIFSKNEVKIDSSVQKISDKGRYTLDVSSLFD